LALALVLVGDELADLVQLAHHVPEQHLDFLLGLFDALNALSHQFGERRQYVRQLLASQRMTELRVERIDSCDQLGVTPQFGEQSGENRAQPLVIRDDRWRRLGRL
jgi:hypothetical protein